MTEMNHHDGHPERDPALDAIGRTLEGRAESLRREPDAGFESRVLHASRVALRTGAPVRLVDGQRDEHAAPPARFANAPLFRIAAGIAVLLTAGVIALLATRGPGSSPPAPQVADATAPDLLDELDSWLALDDSLFADARLVSLRQEVDDASAADAAEFDIFDAEEWM